MGKSIVLAILVATMLLFGCVTSPTPAPQGQNATQNVSVNETIKNETAKNTSVAPPAVPFRPIHLSYNLSTGSGSQGQPQQLGIDYYLTANATCSGRPAINGFMKVTDMTSNNNMGYTKLTVYLDSGEAAYSDGIGESDLAFNTAKPYINSLDVAFWPQTIAAIGGKSIRSSEIWNGTMPVLLTGVAAMQTNGDYSIIAGGMDSVAGIKCKNITISAKTSSMDGQVVACIGVLEDANLSFVASARMAGNQGFQWGISSVSREAAPIVYYPQCLAPITCPTVAAPSHDDYNVCNSQGNSLETTKDKQGCVTSYDCITNAERARRNIIGNQATGCAVNETLVSQNADCWANQGNVEYSRNGQTGCIMGLRCNMPTQSGGNGTPS
jgi:hypothetical protein